MLTSERRERIAEWIEQHGQANLEQLSDQFSVSTDTIRRDLTELNRQGKVRQVRGGALRTTEDPFPYQRRAIRNLDEKRLLAKAAANLIPGSSVMFLDNGSTALCLAEAISDRADLTVYTTNLPAAVRLGEGGKVKTILPGGQVDGNLQGIIGGATCRDLTQTKFDIAVLVPRGVSADGQLSSGDREDAEIKRLVRQQSDRAYFLVAETKLGVQGTCQFAEFENSDTVISNAAKSHSVIQSLKKRTPELQFSFASTNDR